MEELPLFAAFAVAPPVPAENKAEKALAAIVPDALSPREALALVYRLKTLLADKT